MPPIRRSLALACVATALLVGAPAAQAAWWKPVQNLTWYWQLTGSLKSESVDAVDMDGFDTDAATVAALHARGQRVICYVDVGTGETWRPDYGQIPPADLGSSDPGWQGERWLNIADPALRPVIAARLAMCKQKGFDAVEPDNMDGYQNASGFPLTAADQLAYDEWVAGTGHALGMAVLQKNDPDQASALQPSFDGALTEQCNQDGSCSSYAPYVSAGKPVLDAEYQASLHPGFCASDQAAGIMGALYPLALDGSAWQPCFGPSPLTPGGETGPPPTVTPAAPSGTSGSRPTSSSGAGHPAARALLVAVSLTPVARLVRNGWVPVSLACRALSGRTAIGELCAGTLTLRIGKQPVTRPFRLRSAARPKRFDLRLSHSVAAAITKHGGSHRLIAQLIDVTRLAGHPPWVSRRRLVLER